MSAFYSSKGLFARTKTLAEPACFKEPYVLFPITSSSSNQLFSPSSLPDYPMACDLLMDHNGIFLTPTIDVEIYNLLKQ
jgi:hypothetical protein